MKALVVGVLVAILFIAVPSSLAYNNQHTAYGKNYGEVWITWHTNQSITNPRVQYYAKGLPTSSVIGYSRLYYPPAGYINYVLLQNLSPAFTYYYRCQNTSDSYTDWSLIQITSKEFSPFVVPVYGDMGVSNSGNTRSQLNKIIASWLSNGSLNGENLPFFLHIGDISYADDRSSDQYEYIWNQWFSDMQTVLTNVPYHVVPGNHEHQSGKPYLNYTQYFVEYNFRFLMPDYPTLKHNMWWSLDYQNMHIIGISTETDFPGSQFDSTFGDQLSWLAADLAQAQSHRNATPWIVVIGHRPLYTSASDSYMREYLKPVQDAFEDLFHKYNVDLYICGHVHSYERTYPVYKNTKMGNNYNNPAALTEIVVGCAGNTEGIVTEYISPVADWSATIYDADYGYGMLHVLSNTKLTWNLHSATSNAIVDTFTIQK